jgi:hypothetical protein
MLRPRKRCRMPSWGRGPVVEIDGQRALVVGLFIPSEGANGDEAGQLIFYRIIRDPGDGR